MKINEKWTLFLIATFVTFFGIVDTLLKKTAASEVVLDENISSMEQENNSFNEDNDGQKTGILSLSVGNVLDSIRLSEGTIDFQSLTTEYWINVTNFEQLEVYPILLDNSFSYLVEKSVDGEEKKVIIKVMDQDNNFKIYTIYVTESSCGCITLEEDAL